ncbi:P2X purinoceptor 4a isoform X2 [Engraulis encrasicolus]|uniref:P2X purinoceptor 4a isoform X2 n=1 Tax=Engraulis encrasicolus TaxID=184585 RepID=UPI002FD22EF5
MTQVKDSHCCEAVCNCFFDYSTSKTLVIRSKKVGAINRTTQALVIAYIIGYVCVWNKGYQETDTVLSSVTTKVKGIALTNTSDLGLRVWDVADYIIPPQEESSFFVLTNLIVTDNQTQAHCAEIPSESSRCYTDKDCKVGIKGPRSNGVQTGRCVIFNQTVKTCEVFAWCPLERDDEPPNPPMLGDAENFTVLVKNNIRFPKFQFSKRNILPHINSSYLQDCVFSRSSDPECPIFRLKDMVDEAEEDFQTMAVHGGVMGVQIRWDCDLDLPHTWCVPRYNFRRLDNKDPTNTVSPGYNFRFAKYYKNNDGKETRTLIKGYGIRFDIMVFGEAGKFNVIPLLLNVGAGLGLLGLVTVVCDWIVLTFMTKRNLYREQKYTYVDDFGLLPEN